MRWLFFLSRRSAFIATNALGLLLYLYFASWIWAPPSEKGLYGGPGDPIIWVVFAFPFLLGFAVLNFLVFVSALVRAILYMKWRFFFIASFVIFAWCAAYTYDATRQYDGSWLQNDPPASTEAQ